MNEEKHIPLNKDLAKRFPEDRHAPQPPQTNTMEVHHHGHVHEKKKWKEYLFQFLMLFLAVFCGFLAENFREHKIEKDREKVYMKNLLEDLKSDTAAYKNYARTNDLAFRIIDSLMYLLKSPERKISVNRIYYLARRLTMRTDLLFINERTYDEMKSSGQLRLIHNQKVSDSISYYYHSLKQINNQNDRVTERINQYFLTMSKLFNAEILLKIYKEGKEPEGSSVKLLTEDPLVINELLTWAQYLYGTFFHVQNLGFARLRTAENLMELIKEEYHME